MTRAYKDFGLSEAEINILAYAQKKRQYYYRSTKGRRLFDLMLGEIALTFVGMSSDEDHRFMDTVERDFEPEEYAEIFLRYKNLPDAAELVKKFRNGHLQSKVNT